MTIIAKPFLKWAGGKSQLLAQLENYYPKALKDGNIKKYIEPFVGGGAAFFSIVQKYKPETAYLSDINKDLILLYQVVQQQPQALIHLLRVAQENYNHCPQDRRTDLFLQTRRAYNEKRLATDYKNITEEGIVRAAEFIFLNKTCFNGLFRLNSKGEFNVPYGKYKTASILDEANILAASRALQNAEIAHADYSACFDKADENTFIYFDPPYRPISKTASFTTYTGAEFTDKAQLKLAAFFKKLDQEKKAKLMLSNSDPTNENPEDSFFSDAYSGYNLMKVSAGRAINCNGEKRGKITEVLITNYQQEMYEQQQTLAQGY